MLQPFTQQSFVDNYRFLVHFETQVKGWLFNSTTVTFKGGDQGPRGKNGRFYQQIHLVSRILCAYNTYHIKVLITVVE